jgi:hypothetical protein
MSKTSRRARKQKYRKQTQICNRLLELGYKVYDLFVAEILTDRRQKHTA